MKTGMRYLFGILLGLFVYAGYFPASAQQIKVVSGRVLDKETKKPFRDEAVYIYAFNTVAAAKDAYGNIFYFRLFCT